MDALFGEVVRALSAQNLILAEGRIAIVDATVIEAARSGLRKSNPEAGSHVKVNSKGKVQAIWGWNAFVNADEDNFIHAVEVTPGNEAEVTSLPDLMTGGEVALYADKAYIGPNTRALIAARGLADQVQRRGARGHPLTPEGHARNSEIGVTRAGVERIFAHLKHHWGLRRSPFMGRTKTTTWFTLGAICWNLWQGARFQHRYG